MNKSRGSTLLIVLFIALVAASIAVSMMQLTSTKTVKAINNKYALQAFYAAEAGVNEAIDTFSDNLEQIPDEPTPDDLGLPTSDSPKTINGATYFVEFNYVDSENIIVESTGASKSALKKIKTKLALEYDSAFDFGLLSKDLVEINTGNITFGLDIHGNTGLNFKGQEGNYTTNDGAIATQSSNPDGYDSDYDYYGSYRPEVDVPKVDFPYFQEQMVGAIEPNPAESDLDVIMGITDTDNNIMLNEDYLNANTTITIPQPVDAAMIEVEKTSLIALNLDKAFNYFLQDTKKIKSNPVIATIHTKLWNNPIQNFPLVAFYYIQIVRSNPTYAIALSPGFAKYIYGGGKGNTEPTPEPTAEPIPEPTIDPGFDDVFDEDPAEEVIEEPLPPDEGELPPDDPINEEPVDDGNKGQGNDPDANLGFDEGAGGSGTIDLNIPSGDHGGRIYYIDNANVGTLNINVEGTVSNCIIVATGGIIFNGAHKNNETGNTRGMIDLIIAAGGDITHNGSNTTGVFYWLDGEFRQDGASTFENGKVMAQGPIRINGKFELYNDYPLDKGDWVPKKIYVTSWQEIAAD